MLQYFTSAMPSNTIFSGSDIDLEKCAKLLGLRDQMCSIDHVEIVEKGDEKTLKITASSWSLSFRSMDSAVRSFNSSESNFGEPSVWSHLMVVGVREAASLPFYFVITEQDRQYFQRLLREISGTDAVSISVTRHIAAGDNMEGEGGEQPEIIGTNVTSLKIRADYLYYVLHKQAQGALWVPEHNAFELLETTHRTKVAMRQHLQLVPLAA